jgi:hypothetical protein
MTLLLVFNQSAYAHFYGKPDPSTLITGILVLQRWLIYLDRTRTMPQTYLHRKYF